MIGGNGCTVGNGTAAAERHAASRRTGVALRIDGRRVGIRRYARCGGLDASHGAAGSCRTVVARRASVGSRGAAAAVTAATACKTSSTRQTRRSARAADGRGRAVGECRGRDEQRRHQCSNCNVLHHASPVSVICRGLRRSHAKIDAAFFSVVLN